ncbi:MAG: PD40 domain-containing protein [Anaerolineae bacterium]|nr:PD40 domain-containing protein [Anaerolineae bacterium]
MKIGQGMVGRLFVVLVMISVLMSACGPAPMPTPTPTDTPWPTGTARPTFTPTVVAMATKEPTPSVEPATDTPTIEPAVTKTVKADATSAAGGTTAEATPTSPAETPTPAATRVVGPPPSLDGTLLFPIFDTDARTYHIYRLDLASGAMSPLIRQASQPSITPDGERVAWRSWQPDQRGLVSRALSGGDLWIMINLYEAARPDWAPGGDRFVFSSTHLPDRQSRLYVFTGAGEPPFYEIQRHGSPIVGRTPAFTPDGRIVYQGCVENECGLFLMNADGTDPLQLTPFKDDLAPSVSPDGTRAVYMSFLSGYWQVNVVNVDGTGRRSLTDDWYWNGLPVWSPDGRHIIFVSTRDENWPDNFVLAENNLFRLWVMDADGGDQRPLNDFTFRLDGVPAGINSEEAGGWTQERLVWMEE